MNKAQIKRHAKLRQRALIHMTTEPIVELQTRPLGITQELIEEGLARVGRRYAIGKWQYQEVVLTKAGARVAFAPPPD